MPRYKGHWRVGCRTCLKAVIRDPDESPTCEVCGSEWVLFSPVKADAPEPERPWRQR